MSAAVANPAGEAENPRAVVGGNNPPEPTPFERSRCEIDDLHGEAAHWLDGTPVQSADEADALATLIDMLRKAATRADERRAAEAKPFDEGKAEVQARYNTLIGDTKTVKGKAVSTLACCLAAQTAWLAKLDAEKRAAAEAARREAEEKAAAAQAAIRAADAANLVEREKAEALVREAKVAEAAATKAEKDRATSKGVGAARAVSLRTSYEGELVNATAFARFVWEHHHDEMVEFLKRIADRLVSHGQRSIPGVTVHEIRRAV